MPAVSLYQMYGVTISSGEMHPEFGRNYFFAYWEFYELLPEWIVTRKIGKSDIGEVARL